MNAKLDNIFRFRDNEKFKFFVKIYTYIVFAYLLVCVGFIFARLGVETINNISSETVSTVMNFILIPLLFLLSFFRKNDYLFILAELFTILADMFLMLDAAGKGISRDIGFTFFFVVQTVYAVYFYIRDENKKRQLIINIIRPILMFILFLVVFFGIKDKIKYKTFMGAFYIINLLMNLVCAIILKDKILIFSFGIFIVSDIFIGTRMFVPRKTPYYVITDKLNHLPYLLSQVGLAFNKFNNNYSRKK